MNEDLSKYDAATLLGMQAKGQGAFVGPANIREDQARALALQVATTLSAAGPRKASDVVVDAELYLAFLKGETPVA